MFGRGFELFKLFGFSVKLDFSWFIIAVLVTWSLAVGFFPAYYPGLPTGVYWWMGLVGAVGLFASIVIHEFAHSLVARSKGLPMKGITLFVFGGVAEMDEEPSSPGVEFLMAIAGPVASVIIAAASYALMLGGRPVGWPTPVLGVLWYLAWINTLLVAFNLLPAFPLDGGRVFRSFLWRIKGNLKWATRITSRIGAGFGVALILLGVVSFIGGNFVGGMWWALLGMFLRSAAHASYHQMMVRRVLEGEPIRRFVQSPAHTVSPSISIKELVEDHIYKRHFKMFPVADDSGELLGCVTTREVTQVPRGEWAQRKVQDVVKPCAAENTIPSDADAMAALRKMGRNGASRLMVVDNGRLEGVISLKDMMRLISVKLEIEEGSNGSPSREQVEQIAQSH
jgi:Zn-dependent protease/predicted transcriptional regulator